jgi:hypothetical protein
MSTLVRIAGVCALASLARVAAADTALPVPINSSDSAARAAIRTLDSLGNANQPVQSLVDPMKRLSEFALGMLNTATTPEALLNARGGLTINCPGSGTINAKLARNGSHVLKIQWNACRRAENTITYTGASELKLPSDTFTPTSLARMQFGVPNQPFIELDVLQAEFETDPTIEIRTAWDVQVVGLLSMTRFQNLPYGMFTGAFDYRLNGGYTQTMSYTYTDPNYASFTQTNYVNGTDFRLIGSVSHTDEDRVLHEVLEARRGNWSNVVESTYQAPTTISAFVVSNFETSHLFDARNGVASRTVDGKIEYEWPPYGPACGNGLYTFRTVVPVRQYDVFHVNGRDQGKVIVNRGAVVTFAKGVAPAPPDWYTPRPDEQPTTVKVKMENGALFQHTSFFPESTLQTEAQCPAPN